MYLEKFSLKGKTAVVTGGSKGIGYSCAEALGEAGARLVITARGEEDLVAAANKLKEAGYQVDHMLLDVGDSDAVTRAAQEIEQNIGPVDVLIANAGIARSGVAAEEVEDEHFLDVMNTNLNGVFWCCRAFGKPMLERKSGSIVTVGSISAYIVNRPQKQSYYNASKAAVHQLTKCLAVEWADRGVRVNAIAPGYIVTPLTKFGIEENPEMAKEWLSLSPTGRFGQPEEIASLALFLASDASSLMTGSVVIADGGYTCW